MLNEGVFRSPKWMRNFLDFEVNTGQDIKGEPSKRKILKQWDARWEECDKSDFKEFYGQVIKGQRWTSYISPSELEEIKKKIRGDMSIWDKFDEWLPGHLIAKKEAEERWKKREKERAEKEAKERWEAYQKEAKEKEEQEKTQKRLAKELDDLFDALVKDFSSNPYSDKYSTPKRNGNVCFDYRFENGDKFSICGNKIDYKNSLYTLGSLYRNKFVNLCNEIGSKGRTRPSGQKSWSSNSSGSRYSSKTKSVDPNKDRYDKLMDNIKLREEQIRKMSKTDSERTALENELDNYKRAAKRMKDRYQFENIKSFRGFFI